MIGKNLIVIPVYFRSEDQNLKHIDKQKNEWKQRLKIELETCPESFRQSKEQCGLENIEKYFVPWQYTQIIGYIEIRYEDTNLKAYYWMADAKRYGAIMKSKIFKYEGKLTDVSMHIVGKSNAEIVNDLKNFFKHVRRRETFKNRHLDTHSLDTLLPFIDFVAMSQAQKEDHSSWL